MNFVRSIPENCLIYIFQLTISFLKELHEQTDLETDEVLLVDKLFCGSARKFMISASGT
jgi:hypothetical protein